MKFFTPELYLRYSAPERAETDGVEAEWEGAVSAYFAHLGRFSEDMNDRVKKFAKEVCLHDAELMELRRDDVDSPDGPPSRIPVAILSLRGLGRIFTVSYVLRGEITESTAPEGWADAGPRDRWLCDEIDREPSPSPSPRYLHRILLGDGREVTIPFSDVIVHSLPDARRSPARISRRRP